MRSFHSTLLVAALFIALILYKFNLKVKPAVVVGESETQQAVRTTSRPDSQEEAILVPTTRPEHLDLAEFEDCQISFQPNGAPEWTDKQKPIFIPTFPGLGSDPILKGIITQLTGIPTSFRSYYAQGQGFRRCQPHVVACSLGLTLGNMDSSKFDRFSSQVIFPIRNPKTQMPAHFNMKAIMYHGVEGQIEEEDWRSNRDVWLSTVLGTWRDAIVEWNSLQKHNISFYVPYEHLLNKDRGPALVKRIAALLIDFGYSVATEDSDLKCIWYQNVGRTRLQQYHEVGYEFNDYVPGYTQEQKEIMLDSIRNMTDMYGSSDEQLYDILEEYRLSILEYTKLDRKWVNATRL